MGGLSGQAQGWCGCDTDTSIISYPRLARRGENRAALTLLAWVLFEGARERDAMSLPARKYISLQKAAELLNCSVDDIVHWAVNGETKIGIPYQADGFEPPYIYHFDDPNAPEHLNDRLEVEYRGFAFIPCSVDVELSGICTFPNLELEDGRHVMFPPIESEFSDWGKYATRGIEIPRLFIRLHE